MFRPFQLALQLLGIVMLCFLYVQRNSPDRQFEMHFDSEDTCQVAASGGPCVMLGPANKVVDKRNHHIRHHHNKRRAHIKLFQWDTPPSFVSDVARIFPVISQDNHVPFPDGYYYLYYREIIPPPPKLG